MNGAMDSLVSEFLLPWLDIIHRIGEDFCRVSCTDQGDEPPTNTEQGSGNQHGQAKPHDDVSRSIHPRPKPNCKHGDDEKEPCSLAWG